MQVHTVEPDAGFEDPMRIMTEQRIRHVSVVSGGEMRGIGDVVKRRITELEDERSALTAYIFTGG